MFEASVIEARPQSLGVQARGDGGRRIKAWRQIALGARAALEGIGLISLLVLVCFAIAPELRGPVEKIGADVGTSLQDRRVEQGAPDEETADEEDGPQIGRPVNLAPAQANVAVYLARRYHVADEAVRVMVATAETAGRQQQIDPLLILAVVAVESSMNPFAQSPVGARGLMQVMPGLHGGKFVDGDVAVATLDPVANIQVGSRILSDVIRRGGSVERGLQLYVGAGNLAGDGGYANRVLGELGRLKLAATGGVAAALAAGLRSDAHTTSDGADPLTSAAPAQSSAPLARQQRTV